MVICDLRKAACKVLSGILPDLGECRPHAGRFDADELRRLSARTPAVYVAVLGIPKVANLGTAEKGLDLDLSMAAYVVTSDARGLSRDEAALNITEALVFAIDGNRWGIPGVGPAHEVKAANLYSGRLDRTGVAMWAVTWRQEVRISGAGADDDGVVPSELYYGIAPEIGAQHKDDYTRVWPDE